MSADQYPYVASSTGLTATLPPWAQEGGTSSLVERLHSREARARLRREMEDPHPTYENRYESAGTWHNIQIASVAGRAADDKQYEGMRIDEAAKKAGKDPFDFVFDLLATERGGVSCVYFIIDEADLALAMRQPWVSIGSDGSALATSGPLRRGVPHPRNFGTFPRVLGRYVRDLHVLTLEQAVHKMSGLTASQLRIPNRGLVKDGFAADLVIFDPATVADRATFTDPFQYPVGIDTVIVNGTVVLDHGRHTGAASRRRDLRKRKTVETHNGKRKTKNPEFQRPLEPLEPRTLEPVPMRTTRSRQLFSRALKILPGGVDSPVRAFKAVGSGPLFIRRAKGARIEDVDGNTYIDYVMSWGPLIHGHAPAGLIKALTAAARRGTSFGAPSPLEVELGEKVRALMPSLERVRFVSSGTEATMSAVRVARAATGRERIVKFEGCYHGHADAFLVEAGSGALTLGVPTSPGVTRGAAADTLLASYNDLASVHRVFDKHKARWPRSSSSRSRATWGWCRRPTVSCAALREVCTAHGALLVFDEVISGFRAAAGGAQALYGITPDLTCLGKIIGGGLPVGAYGGRADLMELVSPAGPVYQAGHPVGEPARDDGGPLVPEPAEAEAVRLARRARHAARRGPRRRGARGPGAAAGQRVRIARHAVLRRPSGPRLRVGDERRHRPLRGVLPRHAGARRLPAAVAVRSVVPVRRAHGERRGHDHRRREGGDEGDRPLTGIN